MSTTKESEFHTPPANEPGSGSGATQDKPDLDAMAAKLGVDQGRGGDERSDDGSSNEDRVDDARSDEARSDDDAGRSRALIVGAGAMAGLATLAVLVVMVRRLLEQKRAGRCLLARTGLVDR